MDSPRIAFVTTCKDRTEHLRETLPRNLADTDYGNCVFVVLTYLWDAEANAYLRAHHAHDMASGRLVVYTYDGGSIFKMALSKNMAARCAILEGADILITQDADNYAGEGFAQFVANAMRELAPPGVFLCPDHLLIQSLPHGPLRPNRGFAGRLAVWAKDFIKAGGYDEIYNTWRGEDIDMNFRLERMGYKRRFIPNHFLRTIPHGAHVRFKDYPHARQYENIDEVKGIRARTETVVNCGHFGVGLVCRNYDEYQHLSPIPTRVFGIGLHKTATTSLHAALTAIGIESFHWGTGEAPLIWYEMQALGRSKTLEQFYALSDLPIPLLYKQLDTSYPGSKFILTVRNEHDWIESVRRLWSYEHNPTRGIWDIYPFSNYIHTVLYGQKEFNAELFLARYRRHNDEVREYFKRRPDDLLVMDMDLGGDFGALCRFLGRPVPEAAYPQANRSAVEVCVGT